MRASSYEQKVAEVLIDRHEDAVLVDGDLEQRFVAGVSAQAAAIRHVVTVLPQPASQPSARTAVDEEPLGFSRP
jgi:hypothetical protein